jgi:tetratricopeptide (TPR) repeat protein
MTPLLAAPPPANTHARASLAVQHCNLAVVIQQQPGRTGEAAAHYAQGRRLLLEILEGNPENAEAALRLGGLLSEWAIMLSYSEPAYRQSEELFREAFRRLEPIVRREPNLVDARTALYNAHGGRAQLLERMGRYAEAVRDWEHVVELSAADQKDHWRVQLALGCAAAGDDHRAMRLVEDLKASLPQLAPEDAMGLAKVCNLAIEAIAGDSKRAAADRAALTEAYGREGVALLRQFLERVPEPERAQCRQSLREHPMYAKLRERADCRALLAEPTAAVTPGASPAPRGSK